MDLSDIKDMASTMEIHLSRYRITDPDKLAWKDWPKSEWATWCNLNDIWAIIEVISFDSFNGIEDEVPSFEMFTGVCEHCRAEFQTGYISGETPFWCLLAKVPDFHHEYRNALLPLLAAKARSVDTTNWG